MALPLSLLVSVTLLFGSSYAKIPEATCSLTDPNLDDCLKDYIHNFIPQLASEGIEEAHLKPLDPFKMKELKVEVNEKLMKGRLVIKDLVVTGLRNTKLKSIRSDFSKLLDQTLEIKLTNPELKIFGKYNGTAKLESMKVFGDGEFSLHLKDIVAKGKLVADSITAKDGKEYFTVKSVDIVPELGYLKVNATNLYNGNTLLANIVLNTVNKYWSRYYTKMLPQVKPYINDIIKNKINEFTTNVSTDKIVKP